MDFFDLLFLGLALSLDSFAVALSLSLSSGSVRGAILFRYILIVALFHAVMPVAGWFIGDALAPLLGGYGQWIASAIFLLLGVKVVWDNRGGEQKSTQSQLISIVSTLILSLVLSIDALVVGLSLGVAELLVSGLTKSAGLIAGSLTIGVVAFFVTWIGFVVGSRLSRLLGRWAPTIGGVMLILLGLKIVFYIN